jgi:MFS transporter, DHA2 family, multidrug resistance protein
MRDTQVNAATKLDWLGFGSLSVAIAATQLFLDRGSQLDWFSSLEILIEAVIAVSAFYIFIVHTFTTERSFVNPRLFLDRNFSVGILFIFVIGITYLASMALMTPYLQTLMGYPVVTAGLVMGPRGFGTMASMFIVGRLTGKVDTRMLLMFGLLLTAWAMYDMTGWTPDVSQMTIAVTGFIQGAGLGFLFVPLTTVTFATLPSEYRADATGLYNLSRNIGSSVGISVVTYLLTRNMQINHAIIGAHVTATNRAFEGGAAVHFMSPYTAAGRAVLDQVVQMQAAIPRPSPQATSTRSSLNNAASMHHRSAKLRPEKVGSAIESLAGPGESTAATSALESLARPASDFGLYGFPRGFFDGRRASRARCKLISSCVKVNRVDKTSTAFCCG